uniref:Uncharacterized protein n=1 Tax=Clytia hemisphaerica TaxID=252671 RepID=A0A7M5V0I1_9CNID|eukprot:TCONS_00041532-protein
MKSKSSTALFNIKTLVKASETLETSAIAKFNSSGDAILITPWRYLAKDTELHFKDGKHCQFEKGKLAIPIKETEEYVDLFFVCPGLDGNDNVPCWARDINLEEIGLKLHPSEFPEEKGTGTVTLKRCDLECAFIPNSEEISDGDFIKVRSNYYQIRGFCRHNQNLNSVRFTSDIIKNANKAPYAIIRQPILRGNIARLPKCAVVEEQNITLVVSDIDRDNFHGTLNITFRNACFNKLGFLTHDTAIMVP